MAPSARLPQSTPSLDNPAMAALADALCQGDRRALARAITLSESTHPAHRAAITPMIQQLAPRTGKALRLGISGVPGVGKSTFIEALGMQLCDAGHRLAVLAIDPSSQRSGGSILGDKTRMEQLSRHPNSFIRPSPAGRTLGGVARRTREAILLCEAAGYGIIFVETVGVGQSEISVAEMTDLFLLLLPPAGGDELQGLKKGIVEMADIILVNKADGDMALAAQRACAEYHGALRLLGRLGSTPVQTDPIQLQLGPAIATCSAQTGQGITEAWAMIASQHQQMAADGRLATKRRAQNKQWFWAMLRDELAERFIQRPAVAAAIALLEADIDADKLPATIAAQQILDRYLPPVS